MWLKTILGGDRPPARKNSMAGKRRPRSLWGRFHAWADRQAFNWKIREALYRHLATNLENGVVTEIALDDYAERLGRRKRVSSQAIVLTISRNMKNGSSLAEAMAPWIPADEIGSIEGGEMSGKLPETLPKLIEAKRRISTVVKLLKRAFVEPCIYFLAMYGVIWFIGFYVTPSLVNVLPESKAVGVVAGLYSLGRFSMSPLVLIPPAIMIALGYLILWSFPRWTGRRRISFERSFPWSFYRDIQGHIWLSSFLAMYEAGLADVEILKSQCKYATPWLAERLKALGSRMINGAELDEALQMKGFKGLPPFEFPNPDVIDEISSIIGFKGFPTRLKRLSERWAADIEEETMVRIKRYAFRAEIFIYILIGLLAYAINDMAAQIGTVPGSF